MDIRSNTLYVISQINAANTTAKMIKAFCQASNRYLVKTSGDDPSGVAISESMRTQIKGLNTAMRNVQDASALSQTVSSGLSEMVDSVKCIRELVVKASDELNTLMSIQKIQNSMYMYLLNINAQTLGLTDGISNLQINLVRNDGYDVSQQLSVLDAAMENITDEKARMGAEELGFGLTHKNLTITHESLSARKYKFAIQIQPRKH
jgi:flagellin-like hook-associated protein FlgL